MRDKEWLLSFECPLRFIFSHSTLKEGWDNPNVFQVCTLIEQKSTFTQRQKIGRGLRLCVDQEGNRIEDRDTNVLHIMANESFAEFADALQKEIESETGIVFGLFQISLLVGQTYEEETTVEKAVTTEQAIEVLQMLKDNGVITDDGEVSSIFSDDEIVQLLDKQTNIPETAKSVITSIIGNAFDAVLDENDNISKVSVISYDIFSGASYKESYFAEKTITYDEATEIISDMEDRNLLTKDGKMTDAMKKQLDFGTLE
jgi:type III restriction enzyme